MSARLEKLEMGLDIWVIPGAQDVTNAVMSAPSSTRLRAYLSEKRF